MTSRFISKIAVAAAIGSVALMSGTPADAKMKSITIGSNPAGSTYFLLAGGLAKLFQEQLKIRSTAQPHAGSSVYLPLMDKGEISLGLNSSLDSGLAYNGKEPYNAPTKNVRAIARIWVLPYAFVVKADSGIKTVADLRGKRVVINFKTNVSLAQLNRTMLATAGLSEGDVSSVDAGGVVAGVNMVVEGRADATTAAIAMPEMTKAHATVPGGIRVISLGPQANDEFMNDGMAGAYTFMAKPTKTRPFVEGDTLIAAFDTFLNSGTSVADEDAYAMAKAMYENWAQLQKDYGPLRGTPKEGLAPATNPLPYHPGAVKYWKEVGVWTDKNEKNDAKLK